MLVSTHANPAQHPLGPYRFGRCRMFHLTSRTKGKRVARPKAADRNVRAVKG